MQDLWHALSLAFELIATANQDLLEIIGLSFYVSLTAVFFATIIGMPLGCILAVQKFWGRQVIIIIANSCMGFPPVVMGLVVYLLLSHGGALGVLELLYTPSSMIIAQSLLVLPVITALSHRIIEDLHAEYDLLLRSMRVRFWQNVRILLWDARYGLLTALLAGLGRALSEVGAIIIVGGNIAHATRVMTTTIALETSKGNLALALALGIILMLLALAINSLLFGMRAVARHYDYA